MRMNKKAILTLAMAAMSLGAAKANNTEKDTVSDQQKYTFSGMRITPLSFSTHQPYGLSNDNPIKNAWNIEWDLSAIFAKPNSKFSSFYGANVGLYSNVGNNYIKDPSGNGDETCHDLRGWHLGFLAGQEYNMKHASVGIRASAGYTKNENTVLFFDAANGYWNMPNKPSQTSKNQGLYYKAGMTLGMPIFSKSKDGKRNYFKQDPGNVFSDVKLQIDAGLESSTIKNKMTPYFGIGLTLTARSK